MCMYYARVIYVSVTDVYATHTMCYIHIYYAHMSYTCITHVSYTHVSMYTCVYVCLYIHSLYMCIVYAHIVYLGVVDTNPPPSPGGGWWAPTTLPSPGGVPIHPSPGGGWWAPTTLPSPGGVPNPPLPPEGLIDVDKPWIYCNNITYIFNLNPIFLIFLIILISKEFLTDKRKSDIKILLLIFTVKRPGRVYFVAWLYSRSNKYAKQQNILVPAVLR